MTTDTPTSSVPWPNTMQEFMHTERAFLRSMWKEELERIERSVDLALSSKIEEYNKRMTDSQLAYEAAMQAQRAAHDAALLKNYGYDKLEEDLAMKAADDALRADREAKFDRAFQSAMKAQLAAYERSLTEPLEQEINRLECEIIALRSSLKNIAKNADSKASYMQYEACMGLKVADEIRAGNKE